MMLTKVICPTIELCANNIDVYLGNDRDGSGKFTLQGQDKTVPISLPTDIDVNLIQATNVSLNNLVANIDLNITATAISITVDQDLSFK